MAENTHLEMDRDHQHWLADILMWRDDVGLWKEHAQKALGELTQLEVALRQLIRSIHDHEAGDPGIRSQESGVRNQESIGSHLSH